MQFCVDFFKMLKFSIRLDKRNIIDLIQNREDCSGKNTQGCGGIQVHFRDNPLKNMPTTNDSESFII